MLLSQDTQARLRLVNDMGGPTLHSRLVEDYVDLHRVAASGLLVFRIDNWATMRSELQKEMHTMMWGRIGRIVSGERSSFELDDNGAHVVHKLRDANDKGWPRWPIPAEWIAVNTGCDDADGSIVDTVEVRRLLKPDAGPACSHRRPPRHARAPGLFPQR